MKTSRDLKWEETWFALSQGLPAKSGSDRETGHTKVDLDGQEERDHSKGSFPVLSVADTPESAKSDRWSKERP
jgi:hypothetical protein